MRRVAAAFLGLLIALGPAGGVPGAAAEKASAPPRVVAPVAEASVSRPFTGPVSIDFTDADPGLWSVLVADSFTPGGYGRNYYRSPSASVGGYHWVEVDADTGIVDIALDTPIRKSGRFRIEITGPAGGSPTVVSSFRVDGTGNPQILTPGEGHTVAPGYKGPVTIDFSEAPLGPYSLKVHSNSSSYNDEITVYNTNDTGTVSVYMNEPIPADGNYYAYVQQEYDYGNPAMDLVSFLAVTPLGISITAVSPVKFYPRVRDGYRDSTRIKYTTNRTADISATVLNSSGTIVFEQRLLSVPAGGHSWYWNGRDSDRVAVPTGGYRVRLQATDGRGGRDTATVKVTVASDIVTRTRTLTKKGTSAIVYALGCDTRRDDPRLTLDCWGGEYADAIYRFTISREARSVSWKVAGKRLCCDRGRFIRTGTRPNKTTYRVRVGVTGWRAYTIRAVAVTYKYKLRR